MQSSSSGAVVLVLGMHRSGTSTLTRGLAAVGVDLGDNLMPAIKGNNDKGFFEDLDFNNLNIEILESIGHNWDSVRPISVNDMEKICKNEIFRNRAKNLILSKIVGRSIFGIKDPRISRVVPFWIQVLREINVDARLVIACRNPLSVAVSLQRRNDFPYIKSFYMWLDHNLSSLFYTRDLPRIVVDYDKLVDQPREQLTRIAEFLNLDDKIDEKFLSEYVSGFIDQNLRHAKHSREEIGASDSTPGDVIELYRIMREMANSDTHNMGDNDIYLQKIRESHIRYNPALTLIDHSENLRKNEAIDANMKIEELSAHLRLLTKDRDILSCKFSETSSLLSTIQAELRATKLATSSIQEVLIGKLESSYRELEQTRSELNRIRESNVYKCLSRFI